MRNSRTIPEHTESLSKAAIFVEIVRGGSFAAAASALGMARSTVSQHVRSLEESLGARLIERTTRKLRLTDEGELLFDRMTTALEAWGDVVSGFEERRAEPSGTLRVSSVSGLVSSLVAPVASAIMKAHPRVMVELYADDEVRDLIGERIDVAIRMAALSDSRMVARKLGVDRRVFVTAPALAATLADTVEAARSCDWIAHAAIRRRTHQLFENGDSDPVLVEPRYRAVASSSDAMLALAAGGVGVALVPSLLARDALERGSLSRVFPSLVGTELPLYAVYPSKRLMPAHTRAFIDQLIAAL